MNQRNLLRNGWSIENNLSFQYKDILQRGKTNYYKKEGEIGYIISLNWLEAWQKVIYFDFFSRGYKPEYDEERSKDIPPVDNISLLRNKHSFLTDPDETSYLNNILKVNMKMNVDYKIIDEEMWYFFYTKYGGTEVKRYYHKAFSFGAEIEAKLKEFKVVILPTLEDWDSNKIDKPKSIYASKHDKFQSLIDRIIKIINVSEKLNPELTSENVRVWKLAYNHDLDKIIQSVSEAKDSNMDIDTDNSAQDSKSKTVERNTGIKFPGTSFEMMK